MVSHQQDGLQRLMDKFSDACNFFSLAISQKETQIMGEATTAIPCITINGKLEVGQQFQYLGSTTTDTLSLDVELSKCIGKALTILSKCTKRVWENKHLTIPTKINAYKACIISTLLYGSESCSTYSKQEEKLQLFHLRCLCRILGITWQDKVWNNDVPSWAGIPSMFTLLHQHCLLCLGHIHRMEDGHIPMDLLYGELTIGARCRGHPNYTSRMYTSVIWRHATSKPSHGKPLQTTEPWKRGGCYPRKNDEIWVRRTASQQQDHPDPHQPSVFTCQGCSRKCKSMIALYSHTRQCSLMTSHAATP